MLNLNDISPQQPDKLSALINSDQQNFKEAELLAIFLEKRVWKREELEAVIAFLSTKEKISSRFPFLLRFFEKKAGRETIGECTALTPFLRLVKRGDLNKNSTPLEKRAKVEEYSRNIRKNRDVAEVLKKIAEEIFLSPLVESKWALREVDIFYKANYREIKDSPLADSFFARCNSIYGKHLNAWIEMKNNKAKEAEGAK